MIFGALTVHLNVLYIIIIIINISFNIYFFLYVPVIQHLVFHKERDSTASKFVFNSKSIQCKCPGNVTHFVSNVDLFFILFNNKLSTICPKLGGGGGFARKHRSINQTVGMEVNNEYSRK